MEERFKLGATLCYDKEKEKDIIQQLESLKSRHKLGDFISNLIRIAFENPVELRQLGLKIENYGLTDNRREFFKGVEQKVKAMCKKVDDIYDIAVKMYALALMGKKLGLEDKSKNLLQAQFILQKQINELCTILGLGALHNFESNKVENVAKDVEETLEFIINSYDGIISEIKQSVVVQTQAPTVISNQNIVNSENKVIKNTKIEAVENTAGVEVKNDSTDNIDNEILDFGKDVDLDLISSFLNEG